MVLTILLIVACVIFGAGAVLVAAPLQVLLSFSLDNRGAHGTCTGSILHPLLATVAIDLETRNCGVRIFGRKFGGKRKRKSGKEQRPQAGGGDDTPARRNATPDGAEKMTAQNAKSLQPAPPPDTTGELPPAAQPCTAIAAPSTPRPTTTAAPDAPEKPPAPSAPIQEQAAEPPELPSIAAAHVPPPPEPANKEKENVASQPEKKDNWFERLQRNRYVFFIRNSAWRTKVLRWILRFTGSLFHIVRFDRFRLSVRAGVENPMLLGTIAGYVQAAAYGLTMKRPYAISFEPVFMTDHFECSGQLRAGTSLAMLGMPLLVALFTFPAVHTLRLLWRFSRSEKMRRKAHHALINCLTLESTVDSVRSRGRNRHRNRKGPVFKVDPDSDTDSDPDNFKRDCADNYKTVNNRSAAT